MAKLAKRQQGCDSQPRDTRAGSATQGHEASGDTTTTASDEVRLELANALKGLSNPTHTTRTGCNTMSQRDWHHKREGA